jgi:hypothetical protein
MVLPINLYAFCSEPSAPYWKPSKPSVPYCVNEYANTHTCDDWVIESYYSDLDSYRYEVQRYINELQQYVSNASDYANCEISNLD